ncbi:MAG: serine/threonine-protein phosphatase [Myxococcales bacterium]|nr:serine/threonine-protein phosphatase [Myxococcales bacterium]MCB9667948.1 serine/threonine-protein phosphatase [Alphaproteobacteria bacterium]MCB9690602.1 serine/threonine-protein phosphatase [Alphaproteobacteria bacterium]
MTETRRSFGFPLSIAVKTDVGQVRSNNEDSHGHAWLDDGSLFVIVADGMGGHEAGEVASGLAVRVLEDAVARDADADPRSRLYHGFLEVNEAIMDEGRRSGTRGMGTTGVSGILRGNQVHVGLIGDSRLYHVRRGQMVWRTLDHTRVQTLIDRGEITEEAGRTHPEAGMLTRALGHSRMADGNALVPDVLAEPLVLSENDVLVFCSDGLHDLADDWEIAKLVSGRTADEAAEILVNLANERGGHDNITVAVIVAGDKSDPFDPDYVPPAPEPAPVETERGDAATTLEGPVDDLATATAAPRPSRPPPGLPAPRSGPGIEPWMVVVGVGVLFVFMGGMVFLGVVLGLLLMST